MSPLQNNWVAASGVWLAAILFAVYVNWKPAQRHLGNIFIGVVIGTGILTIIFALFDWKPPFVSLRVYEVLALSWAIVALIAVWYMSQRLLGRGRQITPRPENEAETIGASASTPELTFEQQAHNLQFVDSAKEVTKQLESKNCNKGYYAMSPWALHQTLKGTPAVKTAIEKELTTKLMYSANELILSLLSEKVSSLAEKVKAYNPETLANNDISSFCSMLRDIVHDYWIVWSGLLKLYQDSAIKSPTNVSTQGTMIFTQMQKDFDDLFVLIQTLNSHTPEGLRNFLPNPRDYSTLYDG